MKCPECKEGDLAEKKARRGNIFYGCSNYPNCKFTSNYKPIEEKCPECGSPYLIEKNLKSGTVISCPNNRKTAPEEDVPKRRKKKGEQESTVKCDYSRAVPTPEPSVVA